MEELREKISTPTKLKTSHSSFDLHTAMMASCIKIPFLHFFYSQMQTVFFKQ